MHVRLGGTVVERMTLPSFLDLVDRTLGPLYVASVNLDHLYRFDHGLPELRAGKMPAPVWVPIVDGMPPSVVATVLTGGRWPRIPGSDVLAMTLDLADARALRVGFFGGADRTHQELGRILHERWPHLTTQWWSPQRSELEDAAALRMLAQSVASWRPDLLVLSLGRPREEEFLAAHTDILDVRVALAFGAATDFLAGTKRRAPRWMQRVGLEWSYRLIAEPRRLWRRYLLQGPVALWRLLTRSRRVNVLAS